MPNDYVENFEAIHNLTRYTIDVIFHSAINHKAKYFISFSQ